MARPPRGRGQRQTRTGPGRRPGAPRRATPASARPTPPRSTPPRSTPPRSSSHHKPIPEPRTPEIHRRVQYRDATSGRWTRKPTPAVRRAKEIVRETYDYRRTVTGKIGDMIRATTKTTTLKTAVVQDEEGRNQGRIFEAIGKTNAFTVKNVKRVDVSITSKDSRDKTVRFKGTFHVAKSMSKGGLVGFILGLLRARGYRTQYVLGQVPWSEVRKRVRGTEAGMKAWKKGTIPDPRSQARSVVARRKVLHDLEIQVRLRR